MNEASDDPHWLASFREVLLKDFPPEPVDKALAQYPTNDFVSQFYWFGLVRAATYRFAGIEQLAIPNRRPAVSIEEATARVRAERDGEGE